ncbi:hypothetical protein QBC32DRAFT_244876 [Pseudoneurospora amorphoporcata]|uniref:Uncharacterized protein n=1 Tax=Pseudoneurospora amorphoporcata TaxID=241081 RepID=A0AAN6SCS4_9PEZI|nr:hypothetical protein QBC32DRAFT_244876 [Pseudoneurospora amorphoporcata]
MHSTPPLPLLLEHLILGVPRTESRSDRYTQTGRCIFLFLELPWNIDTNDACFVVRQRLENEGARSTCAHNLASVICGRHGVSAGLVSPNPQP